MCSRKRTGTRELFLGVVFLRWGRGEMMQVRNKGVGKTGLPVVRSQQAGSVLISADHARRVDHVGGVMGRGLIGISDYDRGAFRC
ncbi:hypothetical protein CETAM_00565 [Corynebacterium comes]|uniref:Uncharacterized protein n=2 Tax=Corynebacterium comes TaxID=2675218 RepID=A0A6B8VXH6_9CORY|nr:hypothetical protein CETAM_00565 [Corynebacterium comes]